MRRHPPRNPTRARLEGGDRLKAAIFAGAGVLLALSLALAGVVGAQEQEPQAPAAAPQTAASQTAPASKPAAAATPKAPPPSAKTGLPSAPSRPSAHRAGKGPRTLDEITIEGEIAVPQVLFITARERKHYQDFLHRNYLKSSRELCRETPLPVRLASWLRP